MALVDRASARSMNVIDLRSSEDDEVVKLVTFEHLEHLLRGVHLYHVLRRGAHVFRSSTGSASTYRLSRQVTRLDAFLSHNWAVGRFGKFAALAFYFNAQLSVAAMLVVGGVLGSLTMTGQLPIVQESHWPHGSGIFCRLLGFPCVFLATVFFRDLLSCLRLGGPVVFLDKICIHQVDKQLQKLAIEKLGAFLANADTMVVAYTGIYLKKLWTVYEVASFLALHPVGDMRIVPVLQALLFFAVWMYLYVHNCLNIVVRVYVPFNGVVLTTTTRIIGGLGLCAVLRNWARERAAIQSRLKAFSVKDCVCAVESDRPIVYSNIARLMVASRRVPIEASEEVALEAFDKLVQQEMPSAFESALGGTAFSYKRWIVAFAMDGGPACLDRLAGVSVSMSLREALAVVNYFLMWTCTFWPLVCLGLEWSSRQFLALHGWRQWAYLLAVLLLMGVPVTVLNTLIRRLQGVADTSTVALTGFFLANAVGAVGAWTATTWCRRQPQERLQDAGFTPEAVRSSGHSTDHSVGEQNSADCSVGERDSAAGSVGHPVGERDSVHKTPSAADVRFASI